MLYFCTGSWSTISGCGQRDQVAFHRRVRACFAPAAAMQRLQEVSHHGGITAAVSADWRVNVQCCMISGRKIADLQRRRFHVAPNLSAAAHHIDDPLTMLCKGAHRHADADTVFIQQVHDLIVHNIVNCQTAITVL